MLYNTSLEEVKLRESFKFWVVIPYLVASFIFSLWNSVKTFLRNKKTQMYLFIENLLKTRRCW